MQGRRYWTEDEIRILRELYPDNYASDVAKILGVATHRVYNLANRLGIKKSKEWKHRELQKQGDRLRKVGASARFQKGLVPHNTGKPWQEWLSPEGGRGSLTTAFKKGNAPHNTTYDGCIRIRADKSRKGYKYIRISKGKWIELHKALWILLNGEIPEGKILRCKSDDTLNCDPDNWYLTDRATHLAANSGRDIRSDKYMALVLARRDPELRKQLMHLPEILELKRTELTLKETINGTAN